MFNNKGFASVTFIIILVIIIIGGYLLLREKLQKEPEKAQAPAEETTQSKTYEVPTRPFIDQTSYVPPAPLCNSNTPPSITVISPNGGETFQAGGPISVTWQSCNLPTSWVVVSLGLNGYGTFLTDPETTDDGNETFTLPTSLSSGNYKIRIGHAAATVQQDLSDNSFTIQ